jgi:uncharacterized protein YlbG (UPF0298 family)
MYDNIQISLPKVRLIHPNLFEKCPVDGEFVKTEQQRYFGAVFLLDKKEHAQTILDLNNAVAKIMERLKIKKLIRPIMSCGDEQLESIFDDEEGRAKKEKMAYLAGHYKLPTKTFLHPILRKVKGVNLDILKDADPFYPGCYVNAIVELAAYNNPKFGRGISKYLKYVLFAKDGERIGKVRSDKTQFDFDGDSYFTDSSAQDDDDGFSDKDLF